jgi:23S rRNA pseudouridine955/2504/2580 synthase
MYGHQNSLDIHQIITYLKCNSNDAFIPSHIGRLDKLTSCIVVCAKNNLTLKQLKEKEKIMIKIYGFKYNVNENIIKKIKLDKKAQKVIESSEGKIKNKHCFTK